MDDLYANLTQNEPLFDLNGRLLGHSRIAVFGEWMLKFFPGASCLYSAVERIPWKPDLNSLGITVRSEPHNRRHIVEWFQPHIPEAGAKR